MMRGIAQLGFEDLQTLFHTMTVEVVGKIFVGH